MTDTNLDTKMFLYEIPKEWAPGEIDNWNQAFEMAREAAFSLFAVLDKYKLDDTRAELLKNKAFASEISGVSGKFDSALNIHPGAVIQSIIESTEELSKRFSQHYHVTGEKSIFPVPSDKSASIYSSAVFSLGEHSDKNYRDALINAISGWWQHEERMASPGKMIATDYEALAQKSAEAQHFRAAQQAVAELGDNGQKLKNH